MKRPTIERQNYSILNMKLASNIRVMQRDAAFTMFFQIVSILARVRRCGVDCSCRAMEQPLVRALIIASATCQLPKPL